MSPASPERDLPRPPFVAVGGLGGSGTRLIAALLVEFGVFIGYDLNKALDNLAFTLLFKRQQLLALDAAEIDRDLQLLATAMIHARPLTAGEQARLHARASEQRSADPAGHSDQWLQARASALIDAPPVPLPPGQAWGWKEPNTHILLPALIRNFPQMRYIHVVRHGLDMAFSRNQLQMQYWGEALLGYPGEPGPARALSYWCAAQQRAHRLGATMGDRFLWLDYDRLCLEPEAGLERLRDFLGLPGPDPETLLPMIRRPASMGRFRHADCSMFSADDIAVVSGFGFAVD